MAILGQGTRTFHVDGHHYALALVTDLEPGTTTPYEVELDGVLAWPQPDDERPPPCIRTRHDEPEVRLVFGSCRIGAPESLPYTSRLRSTISA